MTSIYDISENKTEFWIYIDPYPGWAPGQNTWKIKPAYDWTSPLKWDVTGIKETRTAYLQYIYEPRLSQFLTPQNESYKFPQQAYVLTIPGEYYDALCIPFSTDPAVSHIMLGGTYRNKADWPAPA